MEVTLVNHMGNDNSVVDAARVSFSKVADQYTNEQNNKLISYLAKHNHWTPFGHTAITLHVKAPIFVARQLGKHQVGLVWNEVSRRYVTDEPEFYVPEVWRRAADNVKQGSSDSPVTTSCVRDQYGEMVHPMFAAEDLNMFALRTYRDMVDAGVCPEQARMVLPQSMYTEWYWTGNLYSFYNVWKLRTDSHTQKETQEIAKQIGDILASLYPVSWEALTS
jgi:thymidylate synthase (FAD)